MAEQRIGVPGDFHIIKLTGMYHVVYRPDADPEWRAHDDAVAAWPKVWAAYLERVRLCAVERTGYASREEAEKEWAERGQREHAAARQGGVRG